MNNHICQDVEVFFYILILIWSTFAYLGSLWDRKGYYFHLFLHILQLHLKRSVNQQMRRGHTLINYWLDSDLLIYLHYNNRSLWDIAKTLWTSPHELLNLFIFRTIPHPSRHHVVGLPAIMLSQINTQRALLFRERLPGELVPHVVACQPNLHCICNVICTCVLI